MTGLLLALLFAQPFDGTGDGAAADAEPASKLTPSGDESEEIRILLQQGKDAFRISADKLVLTGQAAPEPLGESRLVAGCSHGQVAIDSKSYAGAVTLSAEGPLEILGRRLRGEIELSCSGARWTAINVLPLETYLAAVLGGEMPPVFPLEALKAQAVAARSYALMRKIDARDQGRPYHLSATVLSQVYAGLSREDPRTLAAVKATRGEILAEGMTPVEAYFHASCGGETESGSAALGRDLDYLKPVSCPCRGHSPFTKWRLELTAAELGAAAGVPHLGEAEVASRTSTGRAAKLRFRGEHGEEKLMAAIPLRAAIGYAKLPSTWFDVKREGNTFVFEGRGSGHGAGMCQWGARVLAEQGEGYRAILSHYYPGTEVEKIY